MPIIRALRRPVIHLHPAIDHKRTRSPNSIHLYLAIDRRRAHCYDPALSHFPNSALAAIFVTLLSTGSPGAAHGPPALPAASPAPPAPPAPPEAEGPAASTRPLAYLVKPDDYPIAAIDAPDQGAVTVELDVTIQGRVGACRIVESSGSVSLDSGTCLILTRRARFQPARDVAGRAVTGRVKHTLRWELNALPFQAIAAISIG
ncbi:MAG: energy transducer TonB [Sphingomonas bacterium]|nr:energy transducer TonB [Sphingomonas bacterium]